MPWGTQSSGNSGSSSGSSGSSSDGPRDIMSLPPPPAPAAGWAPTGQQLSKQDLKNALASNNAATWARNTEVHDEFYGLPGSEDWTPGQGAQDKAGGEIPTWEPAQTLKKEGAVTTIVEQPRKVVTAVLPSGGTYTKVVDRGANVDYKVVAEEGEAYKSKMSGFVGNLPKDVQETQWITFGSLGKDAPLTDEDRQIVEHTFSMYPKNYTPGDQRSVVDILNDQALLLSTNYKNMNDAKKKDILETLTAMALKQTQDDKTLKEAWANIDKFAESIGVEQTKAIGKSYQEIKEMVQKGIGDTFVIKKMLPEYIHASIVPSASGEVRILDVESLRSAKKVSEQIREHLDKDHPKDLTAEQRAFMSDKMPELGLEVETGGIPLNKAIQIYDKMQYLMTNTPTRTGEIYEGQKSPIGGGYLLNPSSGFDQIYMNNAALLTGLLIHYGIDSRYVDAAISEGMKNSPSSDKRQMNTWISSKHWDEQVASNSTNALDSRSISAWFRDPTHQIILAGTGLVLGGVTGLGTKTVSGMAQNVAMGVFSGTELPNMFSSDIFAESTLQKLETNGLGDARTKMMDFRTRYENLQKDYNEAIKNQDLITANDVIFDGKTLNDELAKYVEDNAMAFIASGIWDSTVNGIMQDDAWLTGRQLTDTRYNGDRYAFNLKDFDPKTDSLIVHREGDTGQGWIISNPTSADLFLTPGTWKIVRKRSGYEPQEYTFTVSGTGATKGGTIPTVATPETISNVVNAVPQTDLIKSSDVETSGRLQTGVDMPIYIPDGWEWLNPETQKWETADTFTAHYKQRYTLYARPKDNPEDVHYDQQTLQDVVNAPAFSISQLSPTPYKKITDPQAQYTIDGMVPISLEVKEGQTVIFNGQKFDKAGWYGVQAYPNSKVPLEVYQDGKVSLAENVFIQDTPVQKVSRTLEAVTEFKTQFESSQYGVGKGLLKFTGYSSDMTITLDGKPWTGNTAPEDTAVDQGVHTVIINKPGFEPEYQEITVKAGEWQSVNLEPTKKPYTKTSSGSSGSSSYSSGGSSTSKSSPTTVQYGANCKDSDISVDGKRVTVVIGQKYSIDAGFHLFDVVRPDGKKYHGMIMTPAEQNTYINPRIEEFTSKGTYSGSGSGSSSGSTGTGSGTSSDVYEVSVSSEPEGAKILVDGAFTGEWTPALIPLAKGYHTLAIYKSGYVKWEAPIWVDANMLMGEAATAKYYSER